MLTEVKKQRISSTNILKVTIKTKESQDITVKDIIINHYNKPIEVQCTINEFGGWKAVNKAQVGVIVIPSFNGFGTSEQEAMQKLTHKIQNYLNNIFEK